MISLIIAIIIASGWEELSAALRVIITFELLTEWALITILTEAEEG